MRGPVVLVVIAAAAFAAAPARAQAPNPSAFVDTYMEAMRAGDWDRVAGHMHPDALMQFKDMMGALAEVDATGEVVTTLFGLTDGAEFEAASPERVFAGFMKTMMGMSPEMGAIMSGATAETIGHLREEDTGITFVVYRTSMGFEGMSMNQVEVLALREHEGQWRALLSGEIEGMAAMLQQQMGVGGAPMDPR